MDDQLEVIFLMNVKTKTKHLMMIANIFASWPLQAKCPNAEKSYEDFFFHFQILKVQAKIEHFLYFYFVWKFQRLLLKS